MCSFANNVFPLESVGLVFTKYFPFSWYARLIAPCSPAIAWTVCVPNAAFVSVSASAIRPRLHLIVKTPAADEATIPDRLCRFS
uniref:Uncharacterized protein n=1 Tax=uncultured marine virus TaxID=186617 RepID=A0A0F7L3U9_9VIRU|nr:hypothetical protein [uncultured marine virus]